MHAHTTQKRTHEMDYFYQMMLHRAWLGYFIRPVCERTFELVACKWGGNVAVVCAVLFYGIWFIIKVGRLTMQHSGRQVNIAVKTMCFVLVLAIRPRPYTLHGIRLLNAPWK